MFEKTSSKISIFAIIIIGLLIYSKTLGNNFVLDDVPNIVNYSAVHDFDLLKIFTSSIAFSGQLKGFYTIYRPLMYVVFAFFYSVSGLVPFFYHAFQVAIHIANSVFILLLFKRIFTRKMSLFLALLFLVHPINYEAVGYLSALQDTLFFHFGLGMLLVLTSEKLFRNKLLYRYLFTGGLVLLSLLSKETAIAFVTVGLFYLILFNKVLIRGYVTTTLVALSAYFYLRYLASLDSYANPIPSQVMDHTFIDRLRTLPAVLFFYITTLAFPKHLIVDQQWIITKTDVGNFYLPLAAVIITFAIALAFGTYLKNRRSRDLKWYYFFIGWTVLGLFIHSHILVPLDMTVADRWFYFPFLGVLGVLGLTLKHANFPFLKTVIGKRVVLGTSVVIILALSFRTFIRSYDWTDLWTLYNKSYGYSTGIYKMENDIAADLLLKKDYQNAEKHLTSIYNEYPNYIPTIQNLGYLYEQLGDYEKADQFYQKAFSLYKDDSPAVLYNALARMELFHKGNYSKAREISETGLKKYRKDSGLGINLAMAEYALGNKERALTVINGVYKKDKSQKVLNVKLGIEQNLPLK